MTAGHGRRGRARPAPTDKPFNGAKPPRGERSVGPFSMFPADHQERIRQAVLDPYPPPRWLSLCGGLAQIESRAWYEWHWHRGIDPGAKRVALSPTLRQLVIDRDGFICGICGRAVEPDDIHIDHIKPVAAGGSDHPRNLQVAHSSCNVRKGATWLADPDKECR